MRLQQKVLKDVADITWVSEYTCEFTPVAVKLSTYYSSNCQTIYFRLQQQVSKDLPDITAVSVKSSTAAVAAIFHASVTIVWAVAELSCVHIWMKKIPRGNIDPKRTKNSIAQTINHSVNETRKQASNDPGIKLSNAVEWRSKQIKLTRKTYLNTF